MWTKSIGARLLGICGAVLLTAGALLLKHHSIPTVGILLASSGILAAGAGFALQSPAWLEKGIPTSRSLSFLLWVCIGLLVMGIFWGSVHSILSFYRCAQLFGEDDAKALNVCLFAAAELIVVAGFALVAVTLVRRLKERHPIIDARSDSR